MSLSSFNKKSKENPSLPLRKEFPIKIGHK